MLKDIVSLKFASMSLVGLRSLLASISFTFCSVGSVDGMCSSYIIYSDACVTAFKFSHAH